MGREMSIELRRRVIRLGREVPMMGAISFGVIDRGTNVLQIRPTTLCPLSCIFCSTDAGPSSRWRRAEYVVEDVDWLVSWVDAVAKHKGIDDVEAHIDTVGEPLTYPKLVELVSKLRKLPRVKVISMQTHGSLFDKELIQRLDEAGIDRINLSIDATDPDLAKKLADTPWYDVKKVMKYAQYIVESTGIDLLIAPVWVPGYNDEELEKIVEFALSIGAGKRWVPLGIQKYEAHKRGRKPPGVKSPSWKAFYKRLDELERRYGVKLRLSRRDFGIRKTEISPILFRVGEVVRARVVEEGWLRDEVLGVDWRGRRAITLVGVKSLTKGSVVRAKVIANKHGIYLARLD